MVTTTSGIVCGKNMRTSDGDLVNEVVRHCITTVNVCQRER